jgi:hypothetical protein
MIVGPTGGLRRYHSKKRVTKKQLWFDLRKLYYLPTYQESKISYDTLLDILRYPNTYYLPPRKMAILPYVSTGILIKSIHKIVCFEVLETQAKMWPFEEPFDMHYLQNVLAHLNIVLFNEIFDNHKNLISYNIPANYAYSTSPLSTIFIRKTVRDIEYEEEFNAAMSEYLTHRMSYIEVHAPDENARIKQKLHWLASKALRAYEEEISIPQLISNYKEKILLKVNVLKLEIKDSYYIYFKDLIERIQNYLDIRPLSYKEIYSNIAQKEGLNMPAISFDDEKPLISRDEERLNKSQFTTKYKTLIVSILKKPSNIAKISSICILLKFSDINFSRLSEPSLENSVEKNNMPWHSRLFVFLLLSHLIKLQRNVSVRIMLDIYRYGFFNATADSEYALAYEPVSIMATSGIKTFKVPLSFTHVFYSGWFKNIIYGYLLSRQHIAKIKLQQYLKNEETDKLTYYGVFAYSIKSLVTLKILYDTFFEQLDIYGNKNLFERFVNCFPLPDGHRCNYENILSIMFDLLAISLKIDGNLIMELRRLANIYDVETLLNSMVAISKSTNPQMQQHKETIPKNHKIIDQWMKIIDAIIKPVEEVRYLLSQHVPNARLRSYIKQNTLMGRNFLYQYIVTITCCEALLIKEPQLRNTYQAIMQFVKESEETTYYFKILRELSFILEAYFTETSGTSNTITEYLKNLQDSTGVVPHDQILKCIKRRNYIHLLPKQPYEFAIQHDPTLKEHIDAVLKPIEENVNVAPTTTRRGVNAPARAPVRREIYTLGKFMEEFGIAETDIDMLNLTHIESVTDEIIAQKGYPRILFSLGIPHNIIKRFKRTS